MKIVSLSQMDCGVLKLCGLNFAIGKRSLENLTAYQKAREKLRFECVPNIISECDDAIEVFELEDSWFTALQEVFEEARPHLPGGLTDALVTCWNHLNAAKDAKE